MIHTQSSASSSDKKLQELYELIEDMEIAMMTTRRPDGMLVTRPMATQQQGPHADLWFVTNIETFKVDELQSDPNINLAYYNPKTREWVSVSGVASIRRFVSCINPIGAHGSPMKAASAMADLMICAWRSSSLMPARCIT
jgi:general stress protein 26